MTSFKASGVRELPYSESGQLTELFDTLARRSPPALTMGHVPYEKIVVTDGDTQSVILMGVKDLSGVSTANLQIQADTTDDSLTFAGVYDNGSILPLQARQVGCDSRELVFARPAASLALRQDGKWWTAESPEVVAEPYLFDTFVRTVANRAMIKLARLG